MKIGRACQKKKKKDVLPPSSTSAGVVGPSSIRELVVVNANGAEAVKVMASPSGLLSRIKPRLETGRREI